MKRIICLVLALSVLCAGCHSKEQKAVDSSDTFRLLVKSNGKYGYCDRNGTMVIPAKYESAAIFSEDMAAVHQNGKNGYIDTKGNMVIQPRFDGASVFKEGKAAVMFGDRWGYIDKKGNLATEAHYIATFAFAQGLASVVVATGTKEEEPKAGYIDDKGKFAIKPNFDDASFFSEGLASVKSTVISAATGWSFSRPSTRPDRSRRGWLPCKSTGSTANTALSTLKEPW